MVLSGLWTSCFVCSAIFKGNFNLANLEEMFRKAVRVGVSFAEVGVRNETGVGKGSTSSARCSIFDQPF